MNGPMMAVWALMEREDTRGMTPSEKAFWWAEQHARGVPVECCNLDMIVFYGNSGQEAPWAEDLGVIYTPDMEYRVKKEARHWQVFAIDLEDGPVINVAIDTEKGKLRVRVQGYDLSIEDADIPNPGPSESHMFRMRKWRR